MFSKLQGRTLYRTMSATCGAAFMLYGYDAGVLGGIQTTKEFRHAIGNPENDWIIPIIASIFNLAAAFMALAVTFFGMRLGRRNTIILGDIFICVGTVLQATTFSVGQIIAGRIVCGAGIGCIASAVPTYMAEMSLEAKERGPEVSYQGALLNSGVALAYWLDLGFVQALPQAPAAWRAPIALQSCFAIFSAVGLFFLPDTPRWYFANERYEEGDQVLARLHGLEVTHATVQLRRNEIIKSIQDEERADFNLWLLFWDTSDYQIGRRLRTSFVILFVQQFLGINMLVYYSTQIFLEMGYDDELASILAAVMNTIFALSCFPPCYFIERIGRRPMMIWAALGCAAGLLVYVVMQTRPDQTSTTGWVSVGAILFYNVMFGFGWVGPPWVYGPEIAPVKYRHVAGGLAACGEWLSTWITVFCGGTGINAVGQIIFIWPLVSSVLASVYVWYHCPETRGRTLEEIDYLFAKPAVRERMNAEGYVDGRLPSSMIAGGKSEHASDKDPEHGAYHCDRGVEES